jgi:hypothetical protein
MKSSLSPLFCNCGLGNLRSRRWRWQRACNSGGSSSLLRRGLVEEVTVRGCPGPISGLAPPTYKPDGSLRREPLVAAPSFHQSLNQEIQGAVYTDYRRRAYGGCQRTRGI